MFRKTLRDLTARKMRTALVVLSVAIGVFGVSAVGALSGQLGSSVNDQYKRANPPDITITSSPVAPAAIQQLEQTPNVQAPIEARIQSFAQWTPKTTTEAIQIVGVHNFDQRNGIAHTTLKKGAFPKPGQVLFESSGFNQYGLKVGQTVSILGAGGETTLTVSGSGQNSIYPTAPTAGFATAFLNFDDAAKLAGFADANTLYVQVQAKALDRANATAATLRTELAQNGAIVSGLSVADPKNPPGNAISNLIGSLLGLFAVIALITSSFLVVNTISTVVAEQRSQIGAMKAVGATTGNVMQIYLALALLYGLLGTVVGLILGMAGSYLLLQLIGSLVGFDAGGFQVAPAALITGVVVGLVIPILAALLPVWLGSRVTIREAIMSYGLASNFGRGLLARLVLGLGFLPQTGVLASRNLIRNRMRVILTVVGLGVAGACIIGVFNAQVSLARVLDSAIKTFKVDMLIQPSQAVQNDKVSAIVTSVPGVKFAEGWFVTNVQNGAHLADSLTGLPIDTQAYDTSKVVDGRWFKAGDTNAVIITEAMKRARSYHVGDTVDLTVGKGVVHWKIVGVTRDLASGDSSFFAPIAQATQAAGAPPGTVQQVLVKLTDSSRSNVDSKFNAITKALDSNGIASHGSVVYKTQNQVLSSFSIIFVLLYIVVLVVAIVGALGLFGTITMNVLERRREIGVMRSVGASTRDVLSVFLTEGLMLGLVGWLLAIIIGFFAAILLGSLISSLLIPLSVSISLASLVLTLCAIMLVAFLAALGPSINAARTQVADILRYG